ncbi:carboxymuconolactone decarboxylase family protein [Streptomyces sp. NPDC093252]|uniref:carboxymuconolactone decarboxylase family protein n=1 Tax=Streptomyces sp. NPDC093252 TaxID=3154980 RepID=UPI00341F8F08
MPRVAFAPVPGDVAEQVRARRGGVITALDATLAHNPALLDAWNGFLGTVRSGLSIGADAVETVALRVAALNGAAYEWAAHLPPARAAGLDEGFIAGLGEGGALRLGGGGSALRGGEGSALWDGGGSVVPGGEGLVASGGGGSGLRGGEGPVVPGGGGSGLLGGEGVVVSGGGGSGLLGGEGVVVSGGGGSGLPGGEGLVVPGEGSSGLPGEAGPVLPGDGSPASPGEEHPLPGTARLRIVVAVTDELTRTAGLTDATAALAAREFPDAQLVELFAVVSCYNMVSRFLNAAGLTPEDRVVGAGRP